MDVELKSLVKSNDEVLDDHSKEVWPAEYLYSQEFDSVFQDLFNQYMHGEFSEIDDHSDFQAFFRMFRKLKEKRNDLEDKHFPERAVERAEERLRMTKEEEIQECEEFYQMMTEERKTGKKRFSWKRLLFGCFKGKVQAEEGNDK